MILAVIPANDRPHKVPGKNVLSIAGKTTLQRTIEAVQEAAYDTVPVVVSNCPVAQTIAIGLGVRVLVGPERIVETDNLIEIADWARQVVERDSGLVEAIILAMACVAIRPPRCFGQLIRTLRTMPACPCVLWVYEVSSDHHPYRYKYRLPSGKITPYVLGANVAVNRQLFPVLYSTSGVGSIFWRDAFLLAAADRSILETWNNYALVCKAHECLEIDEPIDVKWAEFLLSQEEHNQWGLQAM